ncbi:hypothetical protein SBY92_004877 [Candida maltosa Xu316]
MNGQGLAKAKKKTEKKKKKMEINQ